MTTGLSQSHDLAASSGDHAQPSILAGMPETGFNACVELCDRHVGQGRTALRWVRRDGQLEEVSFETLLSRASRFAHLLTQRGILPGDRVAGLLPRTPDLLTVILGTLRAGAVYQPLFTAFGPKAIATRIAASTPQLIVTDHINRPKLNDLAVNVLVTASSEEGEGLDRALRGCRDEIEPRMLDASAAALMLFTSGTTGTPKGLYVPIRMLRAIWAYMHYSIDLRPEDRFWNLADPGWAYGLYYGVIGPLLLGQAVTLNESAFSVEQTYEVIRRLGITNIAAAPTAYRQMAASSLSPPSGVRAISSAGEPLDPSTALWLEEHFDCSARDHFGQSELGMVVCDHHALEHPRVQGSIGIAMPGFDVTTLDTHGRECANGEPGLLAVDRRSPLFWFEGYVGRTEQPFVGNYYLTGDNAVRAADGSFRFIGRDDDVITSSGYRIGPFEVESALMEHPAVVDAAVIGRPDVLRTEVVKAFVVLSPEYQANALLAEDISLFVKQRLAAHSYPREIEFRDELPKTPSGKIQRFILRQHEVEKSTRSAQSLLDPSV